MTLGDAVDALVLGIVEGLTEFVPVSSTGHQIVVADLLNFRGDFAIAFNVIIQLGAILAVVWEYRGKIVHVVAGLPSDREAQRFTRNLLIAFFPAVILGLLFADIIQEYLFNPITVATALVIGGLIILWAEKRDHRVRANSTEEMRWSDALKIGLCQCLALIPGTSRSGSTIMGGLIFGMSRKAATEFSFFLAIPTMIGATVYMFLKHGSTLLAGDLGVLAIGFVTSFIFAMIAVRGLLKFIGQHSYAVFAWYRIAFGLFILATWVFGWIDWTSVTDL
ncbi:MAG: undecaprenyl-diphosphate phosphatase [Tistrella sp.]|uniref:Undecaprenyl-diphosphatase n=2 Tax=Tistrella mobilis TaxID=171437 RepID=I3TM79_TISMK|nr:MULTISPECIES: undecaprenyl-diphosphate phosphatase [Tistrella]HAE50337.1 undecaprenyl-diphosphate phosphatase [Tistrella mobilis]AFK53867.1 undecaprenyl pyrophosphate phosphatase [Tistrella mobilis KA081020-065]MAD39769.1 undecaprenyl-diphosphate phosphatase [Tistrella sp.]MAM74871.1 undecaprenyl-diphosphate phosphatase [Tistrella sp.]MBA74323.1 undecaprenyl-diphosphate phosphatase [Tistrella sp.]